MTRASPVAENMFGKMRGRFDEATAKELDRTLSDAAIAKIVAMDDVEFGKFVDRFNKVFGGKHRKNSFTITQKG